MQGARPGGRRVHPHARIIPADAGSTASPGPHGHSWGIIPADAGNTHEAGCAVESGPDHPRGCGEHGLYTLAVCSSEGSSPRMRGALVDHGHNLVVPGIIPADAGST